MADRIGNLRIRVLDGIRNLSRILHERPKARIIIGGEEKSYGRQIEHSMGLRGQLMEKIGDRIDWSRVHFLGRRPYPRFCKVIKLGPCHMYMSMLFVLSWSFLEAMSMQSTVTGSDTAPVCEVVERGKAGLPINYFQPYELAKQGVDVLALNYDYAQLSTGADGRTLQFRGPLPAQAYLKDQRAGLQNVGFKAGFPVDGPKPLVLGTL